MKELIIENKKWHFSKCEYMYLNRERRRRVKRVREKSICECVSEQVWKDNELVKKYKTKLSTYIISSIIKRIRWSISKHIEHIQLSKIHSEIIFSLESIFKNCTFTESTLASKKLAWNTKHIEIIHENWDLKKPLISYWLKMHVIIHPNFLW